MKHPLINKRSFILMFITIIASTLLIIYLFYLQYIENMKYNLLSFNNNCKIRYIFSPRGIIYDRNHKELVRNKLMFRLILLIKNNKNSTKIFHNISHIFQINFNELKKK